MKWILAISLAFAAGMWLQAQLAAAPPMGDELMPIVSRPKRLPPAVSAAVESIFPRARVTEVGVGRRIVQFYEVSVIADGVDRSVVVTGDGMIVEVEAKIDPGAAPRQIADRLRQIAGDEVVEVELVEVRAELKAVPLVPPRVEYEAKYRHNAAPREVRLSAVGETQEVSEPFDANE